MPEAFDQLLDQHVAKTVRLQNEVFELMPWIAMAQSVEMATNRKPVLVLPKRLEISEAGQLYGMKVVAADVEEPLVALELEGHEVSR